ncbi:MAG: GDSL-type esterase/lipase family protein [Chthonomonadales bacterium]
MRSSCLILCALLWMCAHCVGHAAAQQVPQARAALIRLRNGMPNVFAKLRSGHTARIAYFGGSITAQEGWRVKTLQWFRSTYPASRVEEINATIGGTGSDLGAFRCRRDVLDLRPDLVFIEFAVNDAGRPPAAILRSMEGIVRQIWKANRFTDICFVYTYVTGFQQDLEKGVCPSAAAVDEAIADHYGIPSVNVALRIAELVREGTVLPVPPRDGSGRVLPVPSGTILFSTDGVHPLDAGHQIYAQVVEKALAQAASHPQRAAHTLPEPITRDNWEDAALVPVQPAMLSPGWRKLPPDDPIARAFHNRLPEVWEAAKPGDTIAFTLEGTFAGVYDVMGPDAGIAECFVDGKPVGLRSRFDVFCTYHRLASFTVAEGLPPGSHRIMVAVSAQEPDRSAVLDTVKSQPGFDANKYRGTVLRIGYLMVRGRILGDRTGRTGTEKSL